MKKTIILSSVLFALVACEQQKKPAQQPAPAAPAAAPAPSAPAAPQAAPAAPAEEKKSEDKK